MENKLYHHGINKIYIWKFKNIGASTAWSTIGIPNANSKWINDHINLRDEKGICCISLADASNNWSWDKKHKKMDYFLYLKNVMIYLL